MTSSVGEVKPPQQDVEVDGGERTHPLCVEQSAVLARVQALRFAPAPQERGALGGLDPGSARRFGGRRGRGRRTTARAHRPSSICVAGGTGGVPPSRRKCAMYSWP